MPKVMLMATAHRDIRPVKASQQKDFWLHFNKEITANRIADIDKAVQVWARELADQYPDRTIEVSAKVKYHTRIEPTNTGEENHA